MENDNFKVTQVELADLDVKALKFEPKQRCYSLTKTSSIEEVKLTLAKAKVLLQIHGETVFDEARDVQKKVMLADEELKSLKKRVFELEKENDFLREEAVSFKEYMYFLGYFQCYLTKGKSLEEKILPENCTLEELHSLIDELIAIRDIGGDKECDDLFNLFCDDNIEE